MEEMRADASAPPPPSAVDTEINAIPDAGSIM
jgi:hypothetical protein